jgi:NADPH-dependent 2,4-dienoyl-CoA reductase/sulfur reductase-like enzyme
VADERVDVAVVGGGPAGVAAAATAAEAGLSVLLIDEAPAPGGQIWRQGASPAPVPAARPWLERLRRSGARHLGGASVVDAPAPDALLVEVGGRAIGIRCGRLILATGARELFLPFPGWTLPGVLGVGGAQALLKSGASFAGQRVAIAGSGPLLLPVAASLRRAGARVPIVAEQAPAGRVARFALALLARPSKLVEGALYRAAFALTPYRFGVWPRAAFGDERVREVELDDGHRRWRVPCDALAASFGLAPNLELARLLGCAATAAGVAVDGEQRTNVAGVLCAGEPTGIGGVEKALVEGAIAGLAAAERPIPEALRRRLRRERRFALGLAEAFALRAELRGLARPDTVVCRCEDVTHERIDPAWAPRQAKLYTRAGMGPCQGRVCGAALEHLYGWPQPAVRPPLKPVPIEVLTHADGR